LLKTPSRQIGCRYEISLTASFGDPRSDLLILTMSETESTLRSFFTVFWLQSSAHDSNDGVGVLAQQDMPDLMRHDVAKSHRSGVRILGRRFLPTRAINGHDRSARTISV
jgi:hypothetical protein